MVVFPTPPDPQQTMTRMARLASRLSTCRTGPPSDGGASRRATGVDARADRTGGALESVWDGWDRGISAHLGRRGSGVGTAHGRRRHGSRCRTSEKEAGEVVEAVET